MLKGIQWLRYVLGFCALGIHKPVYSEKPNLKTVFQWQLLEFDYPTPADKQKDIDAGLFTPEAIAPIDVDVYYSTQSSDQNQVFITIPRFTPGVPATLGTVTDRKINGQPIIKPYPAWRWHRKPEECHRNRIVSVFRVKVDECGRLWVLDTGKIGSNYLCPPQILAFDLNTNKVVHRYEFPKEVATRRHLLVTPQVEVLGSCTNTFVYVADVLGFALLVYDAANNRSWRIHDKTFYPYPNYGTYNISGDSFELMDGLLALALSPYSAGQERVLFYHAMSSATENWVQTSYLRNVTLFENDEGAAPQIFHTYDGTRNSQAAPEAIDQDGIMFFANLKDNQIFCWNTGTEYGQKNFDIVASDPVTLQFGSGVKIIRNKRGQQELWILTSRFQKIAAGSLDPKDNNFRILVGNVDDLLDGTKCKSKHVSQNQIVAASYGRG